MVYCTQTIQKHFENLYWIPRYRLKFIQIGTFGLLSQILTHFTNILGYDPYFSKLIFALKP